ncbi:MAG: thiamine-phosphate kinase [Halobacteriales archaeon]
MDEREALAAIAGVLPDAGDDAAVVGDRVLTTDMLHERTDFPPGTTRYTAGWRAVGASLSDVAAMGAEADAALAVYAAPAFDREELLAFVRGARDVCERVGGRYVGGDLDRHDEFTVATVALGTTEAPTRRSTASLGELVGVTGTLGRTGAALRLFDRGDVGRANALFRFEPRVAAGLALAPHVSAMMDSSDGLARSLHQLAEASDCGFAVASDRVPIDVAATEVAEDEADARELGLFTGEDFELVFTIAPERLDDARSATPVPLSIVGEVTEGGVTMDEAALPDRGYTHGG